MGKLNTISAWQSSSSSPLSNIMYDRTLFIPSFERLREAKHSVHKLIVVDLDPSITIGVDLAKGLAELLDNNASADKAIK
jgi:hypothetical protein